VRSPYEEGKRFAESVVSYFVRIKGLDAKIVRIFNTYGPGMSDTDSRVIPRFLNQALSGKALTVHGKGKQKRTFCYVDDLVRGLLIVLRKGKPGEVYNLGSTEQITIRQLAQVIRVKAKSASPITFTDRPEHDHDYRLPSLRKVKKIGWYPTITLRRGITLTLRKYTPE
jgi:nucleoside-diphosphate-sugar epimerase